jgi:hypothetical protein
MNIFHFNIIQIKFLNLKWVEDPIFKLETFKEFMTTFNDTYQKTKENFEMYKNWENKSFVFPRELNKDFLEKNLDES